jgi:hypothetical protein
MAAFVLSPTKQLTVFSGATTTVVWHLVAGNQASVKPLISTATLEKKNSILHLY